MHTEYLVKVRKVALPCVHQTTNISSLAFLTSAISHNDFKFSPRTTQAFHAIVAKKQFAYSI